MAQHANDEAEIRQRVDECAAAIRAMDLDGVMSTYAPDIVSFDVEPPLQHVGAAAKRSNWVRVFAMYQRALEYEIRDLTITVSGDVAFGHSLNRISGTLKEGKRTERWVRSTLCFRKISGTWLITHDHVSVPLDPGTRSACGRAPFWHERCHPERSEGSHPHPGIETVTRMRSFRPSASG